MLKASFDHSLNSSIQFNSTQVEQDKFVLGQYRKKQKDGSTKTIKLSDMLSDYENKEAEN
tara:strand:+ start:349 stop:528 length:180 start_codon:yes stop_codon:yes gene_type:complete